MQYNNPIIPGFYPDPSICRAGEDYFLVTSSFEYFPGVPLFHSRDLVHWEQIGYCLTRESQLGLYHAWKCNGIFAPTIRYHDGTFYMITTNVSDGGNFFVTTSDPYSEWSDPIWFEHSGIDPSLFFDDDGTVYMSGSLNNAEGALGISQFALDIRTAKQLSEPQLVWRGTGGQGPEGPHLFKKDGMYYLLIAEGGTEYGHMVTIARSTQPHGPFEACPHNPVLSHRSSNSPIQATGHADLIEDHRGNWWLVCLGIRPVGYPPCHHLGRETFLAPVVWTDEGWPVVGNQGTIALTMSSELLLPAHPYPSLPTRDDFDQPQLNLYWNFLRNPQQERYSFTERPGWLTLHGSALALGDFGSLTFLARRQQHFDCRATALLEFVPVQENEEAGLVVWMDSRHHYEIAIIRQENTRRIIVRKTIGSLSAVVASEMCTEERVQLSIQATATTYTFAIATEDQAWYTLASGETRYLSTEVAGGFTGVFFALYATGNGQESSSRAYFDWFEYLI